METDRNISGVLKQNPQNRIIRENKATNYSIQPSIFYQTIISKLKSEWFYQFWFSQWRKTPPEFVFECYNYDRSGFYARRLSGKNRFCCFCSCLFLLHAFRCLSSFLLNKDRLGRRRVWKMLEWKSKAKIHGDVVCSGCCKEWMCMEWYRLVAGVRVPGQANIQDASCLSCLF